MTSWHCETCNLHHPNGWACPKENDNLRAQLKQAAERERELRAALDGVLWAYCDRQCGGEGPPHTAACIRALEAIGRAADAEAKPREDPADDRPYCTECGQRGRPERTEDPNYSGWRWACSNACGKPFTLASKPDPRWGA